MTEQPNLLNSNVPLEKSENNVEDYKFIPIRGYPMLRWSGMRPFTSTQFFPAQLREIYGDSAEGWRNKIYWGDNLQVMSHLLKNFRGDIDLVYIDPPFDSKADYKKEIFLKGKNISTDINTFEEKQYNDIWTNDEYLQFMYERLILIRELLSDTGSIWLHCDWRKVHQLRLIMDDIFGAANFQNEVIWYFIKGASGNNRFGRKHNSLLWYTKTNKYTFDLDSVRIPYSPETIARAKRGEARYAVDPDELEKSGKNPGDVWIDLFPLQGNGTENLNYPTQKPESLLERIILSCSKPGGIVFDCFMGSGTTQAVAMKHGRRFIGADINVGAIQTATKRLINISFEIQEKLSQPQLVSEVPITYYAGFEVYNVNHYDIFRNPIEAKDLLLDALEVQRLESGQLFDGEKDGRMVKIMPVNRIATRADLSELITGFDYKAFERRQAQNPGKPVEKITLVCMGHEPDLAAHLKSEVLPHIIDVEVVDILRDKQDLQFKRDSEAKIVIKNEQLVVESFYPMNLLQKLSLQKENVTDWRELVESIMIDWNYDGAVLQPAVVDIPEGNDLVKGKYSIPQEAGTIRVKITDLLSESLEVEVNHG